MWNYSFWDDNAAKIFIYAAQWGHCPFPKPSVNFFPDLISMLGETGKKEGANL